MRKTLIAALCFLVTVLSFVFLPSSPPAVASGWEWRQTDWSGGPGQASWLDDARYSSSYRVDTTSVPGTIRSSFILNPFTKSASPVVAPGALGAWDNPSISGYPRAGRGGGYEVLYRGTDAADVRAVGYASSVDGIAWNKSAANPVLQGGTASWDAGGVSFGPLLDEGVRYSMFFRGYDATGELRYGRAVSPDLVTWQRDTGFVFGPGPAGAWDEHLDTARVFRKGAGYGMWYLGYDSSFIQQLGYAYSPDGITWTRHASNPVLSRGAPGSWDDTWISTFALLERPWAGDYMIAYSGYDGSGNYGIGLAFSPDGVNWTKHAANPVMLTGAAGSWDENRLDVMALTFDGGIYKLVLQGIDGIGRYNIGQAYSDNGLMWIKPAANPVLTPSPGPAWDDFYVSASTPFLRGNALRMFYNGTGSITPRNGIGTATANPNYLAGWLESSVFDAGWPAYWGEVTWDEVVPAGCSVAVSVRTGDTATPDASWSAWAPVANGGTVPGGPKRYAQYRVVLVSAGGNTPVVSNFAIDLDAIPTTWYFAEGYTGPGFDEWITIQNPNLVPAYVTVSYFTAGGAQVDSNITVPTDSRSTIYVNTDLGENQENSCRIVSSQKVICERPMYFRYSGMGEHDWQGGSDAMGSTGLSRKWFFAEGYTGANFEEWITIQNPGDQWATVDVTYFVNGGAPIYRQHRVGPTSRYTVMVNQDAGPGLELSAMLESDQPILAERPMYFNFMDGMDGGHIVVGSPYLSHDWYLAEGATFDPFTEYITIQNPNAADADVAVAYYTPSGTPITRNHSVPANSRYTIHAGADSGAASDLSAYVHSNLPVLVERPMYFNMLYGGLPGGHCAMGVTSPSTEWYFAEGYTGPGFDEWLTVQNPGGAEAHLTVAYRVQDGTNLVRNHTVGPHTRYTINVGADAAKDLSLSISVVSDQPIICERPMYFFYQGYHGYNWPGGHDSQGFAP